MLDLGNKNKRHDLRIQGLKSAFLGWAGTPWGSATANDTNVTVGLLGGFFAADLSDQTCAIVLFSFSVQWCQEGVCIVVTRLRETACCKPTIPLSMATRTSRANLGTRLSLTFDAAVVCVVAGSECAKAVATLHVLQIVADSISS